ncbi:MAG TPA: hypothetical protein VGT44_01230 [Ktedonobacteraceae bacterium]|nr:hypothetical protein [Ktedonobacteraceae bacterium]
MQNDPATDTLSAQSPLLVGPLMALTGVSQNQSPPTLHLASVQGNSGQVTDSYPLQVPPGPGGFQPQLALTYSSSGPNERHAATSPAADEGDGWSLSLGSISEETYGSTVWYFLNDVAGVGDRLIYNSSTGLYDTQHLSYLKIQQVTSSTTNQPCFDVWDKSGTFNEIGCTSTSLQYWTDSSGQHNYQWDVDKIVAPNEGPNASVYRLMLVTYVQDSATTNGYTTIRDAALQEIVYGTGTSTSTISKVVGTVDFFYHGPSLLTGTSDSGSILTWITPYGTNYACASSPPVSTPLRCDNPQDDGTEQAPLVMSTLTLDKVVSYVGTDAGTAPVTRRRVMPSAMAMTSRL